MLITPKSSRYTPPAGRSIRTDSVVSSLLIQQPSLIFQWPSLILCFSNSTTVVEFSMTVLEFALSLRVNYFGVVAEKSLLYRSVNNSKKFIIPFSRWSQHSNWRCSFYFINSWTVVEFSMTVLEFVLLLRVNYFGVVAKKSFLSRSVNNSKKFSIHSSRWSQHSNWQCSF